MNTKRAFVPFGGDAEDAGYILQNGLGRVSREYSGETPNGNPCGGRWVYRDGDGNFIDIDQYRHDLFERHDIEAV